MAEYQRHTLSRSAAPGQGEPITPDRLRQAAARSPMPQERSATAVLLSRSNDNAVYLTANHALELPDTIIRYFDEEHAGTGPAAAATEPRRIESIAINTWQTNRIVGDKLESFAILARDPIRDVAVIGVREPPDRAGAERWRARDGEECQPQLWSR